MVVYVLVAQRDRHNPLADQCPERMHDPARITPIPKARRDPVDQPDCPIRLPQQQRPCIRGYRPAVERGDHAPAIEGFEKKLFGDTLCLHRTPLGDLIKSFSQNNFLRFPGPMHLPW